MLLVVAVAPLTAEPRAPDTVDGLVAWYRTESIHRRAKEGDLVRSWADSSGRGHDLRGAEEGPASVFHTNRLKGRPIVAVGRSSALDVTEPFELGDHTIFLVFRADRVQRALFQSDADPLSGLLLFEARRGHQFQWGKDGRFAYSRLLVPSHDFSVTVLGREHGVLHAFLDGTDVSALDRTSSPLRVARFFALSRTRFIADDGAGLELAEMVFYERYLDATERRGVSEHLAQQFGITLTTPAAEPGPAAAPAAAPKGDLVVRLSSRSSTDLNVEAAPIDWDVVGGIARPFRFDADAGQTALYCVEDARVRLRVSLALLSEVPEARLRLFVLKNGTDYLPQQGLSGPFEGNVVQKVAKLDYETELTLKAGDFIEIVASKSGAPGRVWLEPASSQLTLERLP